MPKAVERGRGPAFKSLAIRLAERLPQTEEALRALGDNAVPDLVAAFQSRSKRLPALAARACASLGAAAFGAVPAMVAVWERGRIEAVDVHLCLEGVADRCWDGPGDDEAVMALMRPLCAGADREACRLIIRIFGALGPTATGAVPLLTRSLHDPDLRDGAIEALGKIGPGSVQAVPTLEAMLGWDTPLRKKALKTLALMGASAAEAGPAILRLLEEEACRAEAAVALGWIGHEPAYAALLALLRRETDARVRRAAALAIARLHPRMGEDRDPFVEEILAGVRAADAEARLLRFLRARDG